MLPWSLVGQEGTGFDIFWIILPLLCCVMLMSQRRSGKPRELEVATVTDHWYTSQDIETTYKAIEAETSEWRKEAEERKETQTGIASSLRGIFGGGGRPEERFIIRQASPPRLFQLTDSSGPIYFELTEVEGGGTVVKATYGSAIRSRMAKFKAGLPLRIPAAPVGNRCPSCGKPVLPEFAVCPYCGTKLIKE